MTTNARIIDYTPRAPGRRWRRSWGVVTLIGILAVLAVGAGAAAGNVISVSGQPVEGGVTTAVGQALVADKPVPLNLPDDRKYFSSVSDDHTKFTIALELIRGEKVSVIVPIVNRSKGDVVAEFVVIMPNVPSLIEGNPGISMAADGSGEIDDVVSLQPNHWTFTADGGAGGDDADPIDGLKLTLSVAPTSMAGYFTISGRIKTVEY